MAEVGGRIGKICQPCLNKDIKRAAEVFCPTCNEFQCNDCTNIHKTYAFMKNHKLLTVTEGMSHVRNTLDMKGLDVCTKHNKPFEFFCGRDKSLACSTCAIVDHKSCKKIVEIKSLADDGLCDTLIDQLQQAITNTNQAMENLTEAEACLTTDIQSIPKKLSEMATTIIHAFEKFAGNVTQDASTYRDKTITEWTNMKHECEIRLKNIKHSMATMNAITTNGTPSQQFIAAHSMTETIHGQVKNTDSLCADVQTLNVTCNFDQYFDTLKSTLISAMNPREFEINFQVHKETKLVEFASIDLTETGDDVEKPLYSGLDFLPDGRLVAVDNRNGKCLLYDVNLRLKTAYKLQYKHPKSVVAVSEDEVAITTGIQYILDFFHVSKSNVISWNRTCEVGVMYDSISLMNDGNFVASTIDHNSPVRIVSMSGEEKDFDIVFPSKKYPNDASSCTYIRGQNKAVFTDRYADTVYIHENETDKKFVTNDDQKLIKSPNGVVVGPYDHVFVGSFDTTSLVEITPAGRVLSSHQVDMKYPCTLAISKDRRILAVSNSEKGSLKLKLYQICSVRVQTDQDDPITLPFHLYR